MCPHRVREPTPVVARKLSSLVIVKVPVQQTPASWASMIAAFQERPIVPIQSAVVV